MFLAKKILAALILPPAGPVLLALLGLWLSRAKGRGWQRAGVALAALSLLALLALATPLVGNALMAPLQPQQPISPGDLRQAQAIVILGGGSYAAAPEYGGRDTAGRNTLVRLRYGARLARDTRLPVLVSGGAPYGGRAEADSMREVLEGEFGIPVRWAEGASRDTAENARFSAPLLSAAGIRRVALVTHASHMPRAAALFEREGLTVFRAPTMLATDRPASIEDLLPRDFGLSREALQEHLGRLFYRLAEGLP